MGPERKRKPGQQNNIYFSSYFHQISSENSTMAPGMTLEQLTLRLFEVEGLKFGSFTMRTGEVSPVYVDMRVIWSYPDIVKAVCDHMWEQLKTQDVRYEILCGIPYQGIPLATCLSTKYEIPMLLKRKAPKTYGTCKAVEGHYKEGQSLIIIDDVLMTGGTFIEDIPFFRNEKLEVAGAVTFFDREQGGRERIRNITGVEVYCCLTLSKAFEYLLKHGKVTQECADKTMEYIRSNRFDTETNGVAH